MRKVVMGVLVSGALFIGGAVAQDSSSHHENSQMNMGSEGMMMHGG